MVGPAGLSFRARGAPLRRVLEMSKQFCLISLINLISLAAASAFGCHVSRMLIDDPLTGPSELPRFIDVPAYDLEDARAHFGSVRPPVKGLGACSDGGRTALVDGELRARFPANGLGGWETGFSFFVDIPPQRAVTMEYDVWFDPGFNWTMGGKLPGLCGGQCPRGCASVGADDGFSARLMWHRRGGLITYAYHLGKTKHCGDVWPWALPEPLQPGRWYTLRHGVLVNSPGAADGEDHAWLDDVKVHERRGIVWQGGNATIDKVYMTTYTGGSSDRFRAPRDQEIRFRAVRVWTGLGPAPV